MCDLHDCFAIALVVDPHNIFGVLMTMCSQKTVLNLSSVPNSILTFKKIFYDYPYVSDA